MDAAPMIVPTSSVALLGFGTRAAEFAALLAPRGVALRAWDPRLAAADAATLRAHIEAAGVDAAGDPATALRGARLVVLDALPMAARDVPLVPGQQRLDLASATAAEVNAVLVKLGVPPAAARWAEPADAAAAAIPPATAIPAIPAIVHRGPLP
jgi:hypothetical protein